MKVELLRQVHDLLIFVSSNPDPRQDKLFAANQHKPDKIVNVLVANRSKLLRFFGDFKTEKEDEQFEADKAEVVKEIAILEPRSIKCEALNQSEIPC